ncbi:acetylornithine transaminase [Corynebacterium sp. HMSC29G08]|uniref:acetylornithine transaminase n=1 Tax=Corynebacterium sp. HMSC29G08 TaxID=1581069 RepID=UPI0008A1E0E9|nr:acetylornithine transaminase [Corynebacterium sp. HMSC29G08]OFT82045.1 acetylornithine aminotransferase [Corynebacterium sp. HMSC29G08]
MTQAETAQEPSAMLSGWNAGLMNNYGTPPVALVSGRGVFVTDDRGNEYLDMLAGIAVNALGYGHPKIVEAVSSQIQTLAHVSNLFASQPAVDAAGELVRRFGDDSARVFFCNSGAEANEAAFKLARLTGKRRILAAQHGFHGRTMGSLALTGQPAKRAPFEPVAPGVEFYPYGDIDYVRKLVAINPDDVAAIFLEPIQGETGVIPAPEGFLGELRKLCDAHGILLVCDEVQAGVGRTGTFFAFEHDLAPGVRPDVVTMAKGIGGGLPLGAVIATGEVAKTFTPGSHGTTFGGNPVACAAANAVLDVIDKDFLAEVARKGDAFAERLRGIDGVKAVRGRGLMVGAVLERGVAKQTYALALKNGLIVNAPANDVIRFTPPLVITDEELDEAATRFAAALREAMEKE